MNGTWQNATILLSKNLPHGHFRIRVFTPGMQTEHHYDDRYHLLSLKYDKLRNNVDNIKYSRTPDRVQ